MYRAVQVITLVMVAMAMALSLAHALELPGKLRLDRETYLAVQKIYYPGFTIGGLAEPAGIIALLVLLAAGPHAGPRLWWTLGAFVALAAAHAVYWFVTHPVNSVWTKGMDMDGMGAAFFSAFGPDIAGDWARLRDVWEYSHVARSVLSMLSLVCLTLAFTA
jgi:hypothetical protein